MKRIKFGKKVFTVLVAVLMMSLLVMAVPGAVGAQENEEIGTIEVLGVWGGEELASFQAMVEPWEEETGGTLAFTGTRDLIAVLTTRVQAGNPPDVAILPNPGQMRELVEAGHLVPLDEFLDMDRIEEEYTETWIDLGTVEGNLYAIFMKATNKGIVWYNPSVFEEHNWEIPQTWDEMIALSDQIVEDDQDPQYPWSVGIESGAATGWPGTDWIAQIFLAKYGEEAYDQWVAHEIPWTDERVRDAWELFGEIVFTEGYVPGGATAVMATNFQDASFLPFQDPPVVAMHYGGDFVQGFIEGQFPELEAEEDYSFFSFPDIDHENDVPDETPAPTPENNETPVEPDENDVTPVEGVAVTGGADLVVAFNDSATVRSFVEYLSTADAQVIWVERGGFTSVNMAVDLESYPDEIARRSAEMLIAAEPFRFGAGDIMPSAVQSSWWGGVIRYLQNPDQLDQILEDMEAIAETAYAEITPMVPEEPETPAT